MRLDLSAIEILNLETPAFLDGKFEAWRDRILAALPSGRVRDDVKYQLSVLDPLRPEPVDGAAKEFRQADNDPKNDPDAPDYLERLSALLAGLACAPESAPFVAQGMIFSGRIDAAGDRLAAIAERLKDPKGGKCPGAVGLSDPALARLDYLQKHPEWRESLLPLR
jgi:hypothetical protein